MPIETNLTLQDISVAFCDRCNVEQALTHGFLLLPVMVKSSAALEAAGWKERDEGVICPGCVSEEPQDDAQTEVGLAAIASLVNAEKKASKKG